MKKVLCIAAHPDDEILGCGGTLTKHAAAGDEVQILIAAEGLTSRDDSRNVQSHAAEFKKLYEQSDRARQIIGASKIQFLGLPDNRMDQLELLDIVKVIEAQIQLFQPEIIYTHFSQDLNIDHQLLNQAVLTACRPQPGFSVKKIYEFEVVSATGWNTAIKNVFQPQCYVNIEKYLDTKLAALAEYKNEMRAFPHARSIKAVEALATFRGSTVGCAAAEAFMLVREIVD